MTCDKIKVIRDRLKIAQDRHKSYADNRRSDLEFEVRDMVFLRISPWNGVLRFGKRGKLSPQYIGSYRIVERIGEVAYRLEFPFDLNRGSYILPSLKGISSRNSLKSLKITCICNVHNAMHVN